MKTTIKNQLFSDYIKTVKLNKMDSARNGEKEKNINLENQMISALICADFVRIKEIAEKKPELLNTCSSHQLDSNTIKMLGDFKSIKTTPLELAILANKKEIYSLISARDFISKFNLDTLLCAKSVEPFEYFLLGAKNKKSFLQDIKKHIHSLIIYSEMSYSGTTFSNIVDIVTRHKLLPEPKIVSEVNLKDELNSSYGKIFHQAFQLDYQQFKGFIESFKQPEKAYNYLLTLAAYQPETKNSDFKEKNLNQKLLSVFKLGSELDLDYKTVRANLSHRKLKNKTNLNVNMPFPLFSALTRNSKILDDFKQFPDVVKECKSYLQSSEAKHVLFERMEVDTVDKKTLKTFQDFGIEWWNVTDTEHFLCRHFKNILMLRKNSGVIKQDSISSFKDVLSLNHSVFESPLLHEMVEKIPEYQPIIAEYEKKLLKKTVSPVSKNKTKVL